MLNAILVCPVCHADLNRDQCIGCGREYPAGNYTPIPSPDPDVRARWGLWEQLQANGSEVYDDDPAGNLAVGDRSDAQAFAEFAELEGRVLDVGCGPQPLPSYSGGAFVGLDPLAGERREFEFVHGIAEYLPFRDNTFDRILFATSLDHMLSPQRAIREARRVLAPDGLVCVWHGEPPNVPLRERARRRLLGPRKLLGYDTPSGAVDPFHFSHPRFGTILEWMTSAGLVVVREQRDRVGNCFAAARR